jgi:trigger factor
VVLDYQGYFAGEALTEAKAENIYMELGSGKFNLDFEKNLLGLMPGAETRFAVDLPSDFFNPLIAGKVIDFQVKVHEVKEKAVPELDDDFAQSLGGDFQTAADLRQAVREDIIKNRERERQGKLEDQALDQLIAAHPFEAPPALIRQEQEAMLRDQLSFLQQQKLNLEGLDLENMLERTKPKGGAPGAGAAHFRQNRRPGKYLGGPAEVDQELAAIAERSKRPLLRCAGSIRKTT